MYMYVMLYMYMYTCIFVITRGMVSVNESLQLGGWVVGWVLHDPILAFPCSLPPPPIDCIPTALAKEECKECQPGQGIARNKETSEQAHKEDSKELGKRKSHKKAASIEETINRRALNNGDKPVTEYMH
jgi:hypothetical protein